MSTFIKDCLFTEAVRNNYDGLSLYMKCYRTVNNMLIILSKVFNDMFRYKRNE